MFMEVLDGTIVAPAAPSMARSFHVPAAAIAEVIAAYLLTVAALIPASGWAAARFGPRRIFCIALAGFAVASALCGTSTNLTALAAARVLQGSAGAMMVPVGRLAVLRATRKQDLVRAIAYLTWPALLAPVGAPVLGGALTTYLSWRWIFFVNVPISLTALPLARRLLPAERLTGTGRLDWTGLWLTAGCLILLTEAASVLSTTASAGPYLVLLVVASAVLGSLGVAHLRRSPRPLLTLDAMATRTFRLSHTGGSLFRLTVNSVPFLLPLMFEQSFRWSPVRAGSMVAFLFLGNVAIKPLTTPALRHLPFRWLLAASCAAEGASLVMLGLVGSEFPVAFFALALVLSGIFRSVGFTSYNTISFSDIGRDGMRDASTLSSTIQQLAAGLGVAAGSLALKFAEVATRVGPTDVLPYRMAFFTMAALLLPPTIQALRLPTGTGSSLRPGATSRT